MNVIEMKGLKKSFPVKGGHEVTEAVKGITITVKRGEIFGFLGPNGAGKTTTMRMLTTLLPVDEGEIRICSYDVKSSPGQVRRHIGYVGQLGGADQEATGRENLVLSGRLYGMTKRDVRRHIESLLDLMDLREIIDRLVKTYSGGQRRRLEIALGILHRPEVLFLDEPTTGLDPQNRANLWQHIRRMRGEGMTVFLTTHYLEEADQLCDRICIMDKGVVVAEGSPMELKKEIAGNGVLQPSLDDVFLKRTGRSLRDTGREEIL